MKRRDFIKITGAGAGGILLLPHFLTASNLWKREQEEKHPDNILVFIQLNGGNDGLNTFIPYQDPLYLFNRPTIGITPDKVINSTNGMGFHPALKDFARIAEEGNLSIIQNVGYPNPNRSHFRSQEIWQTASDSQQYLDYGWLGRFLDIQCKEDLLPSLNVDSIDNLALKGKTANGITIKDFNKVKNYTNTDSELKLSDNPQLDFVRKLQYASIEGMEEINKALNLSKNYNVAYANNALSKNLEWIAKLIKGNLSSTVYYTALNGFDTHNNQLQAHARQLGILNDAVFSFYQDLKSNNLLSNITLVVFSEFGRRVKENGTGTDHGTAGPMFIIGGNTKGKVVGSNPDLSNLDKGDLQYKIDFRSVYASILHSKFKFNPQLINLTTGIQEGIF
jgi:uncharacterized protein (DUF1501 family)